MPRARPTRAERWARHREAMLVALELGCTPREAEAEIARRKARSRWEETRARLEAKRAGRPLPPPASELRPLPWWQRD